MGMGSKRRLSGRIGLCAALVCGLLTAGSSAAVANCETVWVDVYEVELEAARDTYRIGDTAVLSATLTREDTGTPVADASFVSFIRPLRKQFSFAVGRTDDDGHTTLRLKLKRKSVKPGPAKVTGVGFTKTGDPTSCAEVVEYGEKTDPNAFTIKR